MFKNDDNKYKIAFIRGMKDYVENLQGLFLNEVKYQKK